MAAQKETAIEFLPQEDWERTGFGRLLKWTLSAGKRIVILTELIVILAFLSRFKLDRDLTDLNEKIKQQQAIVTASSEFEKEFRQRQQQLITINQLDKKRLDVQSILVEIEQSLPTESALTDLQLNADQINLEAKVQNEYALATLLYNLKNSKKFGNITLSQIDFQEAEPLGISFQLSFNLKGG